MTKERLNQINTSLSSYDQLENALEEYAISSTSSTPNYSGFKVWYNEQINTTPRAFIFNRNKRGSIIYAYSEIIENYRESLSNDLKKYLKNIDHENLKQFIQNSDHQKIPLEVKKKINKYKLLIDLHAFTDRGRSYLNKLADQNNVQPKYGSNSELISLSAIDLRHELFIAIKDNDEIRCAKILGMLHSKADKHDPGELDYLEALYNFKSCKYKSALEYANCVEPDHIDFLASRRIILECLARLGNDKSFAIEASKNINGYISPATNAYLYLLLVSNLKEDTALSEVSQEYFKDGVINDNDPAYYEYCETIGELAIECFQRDNDLRPHIESLDLNEKELIKYFTTNERRYIQLVNALKIDPDFIDFLNKKEYIKYVMKSVWKFPKDCLPSLYQAFLIIKVLYTFHNYEKLIENWNNIKNMVLSSNDKRKYDILDLVSQSAIITKDLEVESEVRDYISSYPIDNDIQIPEPDVRSRALITWLSEKGRLILESANSQLGYISKEHNQWKDAGTVSLGYFKILEIELNAKIIKPLLSPEFISQLGIYIDEMDINSLSGKKKKRLIFWENILSQFQDISNNIKNGLELGVLEIFFQKIKSTKNIDSDIKIYSLENLYLLLTDHGKKIFQTNDFTDPINVQFREKYRNPPAHTRLLPLPIAKECKIHVLNSLELYKKCIKNKEN